MLKRSLQIHKDDAALLKLLTFLGMADNISRPILLARCKHNYAILVRIVIGFSSDNENRITQRARFCQIRRNHFKNCFCTDEANFLEASSKCVNSMRDVT